MNKLTVRRAKLSDVSAIYELIAYTSRVSFAGYYPPQIIEGGIEHNTESILVDKVKNTHFYVATTDNRIVGCGSIYTISGARREAKIQSFYIHPNSQGQGVGKAIMEALESDEWAINAEIINISSSVVALPFYHKMGYTHRDGKLHYEDGHFDVQKSLI